MSVCIVGYRLIPLVRTDSNTFLFILLLLLFSHSVMSGSLQPRGLQHAMLPYTSPSPGACSNSSSLSGTPSNHFVLFYPLFPLHLIFPSIRVFSNESVLLIRWPKYWSFSFSISLSNEYSGLISFRINWFDLVVQGTQDSSRTPQFKSINSLVLSLLYGPTLTFIHDY